MKRASMMTAAVVGAAALALGFNSAARAASAKEQISEIEHKAIAATSTEEAFSFVDPDDIVLFDFVPPLEYKGATAVKSDFDNFFNNATDVKGEFKELQVVTDGKLAVAYSIQHFTWKDKTGKPMEGTLRVTDAYHKVGGQWKMFHSHVSAPIDPKTGQGQMNLNS